MTTFTHPVLTNLNVATHLRGHAVYLELLEATNKTELRSLAKDERIWEFTRTLMITDTYDAQFDEYFDIALRLPATGGQAFVVRAVKDDRIIGMTRMFMVEPKDRRLEIGHTWYIPSVWGKVYNKECKLLLLQYIFEHLQFCRAEFRVMHQNVRSQKAVGKIGGVREGLLRKMGLRNDGAVKHTVIFSIIDEEWPATKEKLQQLIGRSVL